MASRRRRVTVAVGSVCVLGLSACSDSVSGPGSDDDPVNVVVTLSASPATTTTMPATVVESSVPSTTATVPSSSVVVEPAEPLSFPVSLPEGECSVESIERDTQLRLVWTPGCEGVWAVGRVNECPEDIYCEGLDIFRWGLDGWQHRGYRNAYCVFEMYAVGMPRAVNDELLGFNYECAEGYENPISPEPETGPLSIGDEGPRVARLQEALVEVGVLDDAVDGIFGSATAAAVNDLVLLTGIEYVYDAGEAVHRVLGLPWVDD